MTLVELTQYATYWSEATIDANGDPTWGVGVLVLGRWAEKDGLFTDDTGNNHEVRFVLYTTEIIPERAMIVLENQEGVALPVANARILLMKSSSPSISDLIKYVM